jgi:hypothetical protein
MADFPANPTLGIIFKTTDNTQWYFDGYSWKAGTFAPNQALIHFATSANSGSTVNANSLNFINTQYILANVQPGLTGNANISFALQYPVIANNELIVTANGINFVNNNSVFVNVGTGINGNANVQFGITIPTAVNSGTVVIANSFNYTNTNTVNVTVSSGIAGNANIAFESYMVASANGGSGVKTNSINFVNSPSVIVNVSPDPAGNANVGFSSFFPTSANSGSTVTSNGINFVNTSSVQVNVQSGLTGNANISLESFFPTSANSGSTITSNGINFINTRSVQVNVQSGLTGNANISFQSFFPVSANTGSTVTANGINFTNTESILVAVQTGQTGNANISFSVATTRAINADATLGGTNYYVVGVAATGVNSVPNANTGFYFNGNTATILGSLGVGVTPTQKLEVNLTSGGTNMFLASTTQTPSIGGGGQGLRFGWNTTSAGPTIRLLHGGSYSDAGLLFSTWTSAAEVERMRLDTAGNLGIGASPSYPLDVVKNGVQVGSTTAYLITRFSDATPNKGIHLGYDSGSQTGIVLSASSAASSNLAFWNFDSVSTGWAERARITSTGRLGIGTTNPAYRLQVSDSSSNFVSVISGTSATAGLLLGDTDSATVGRVEYENLNNAMTMFTNGSERIRITSGGNVGVGVSPSVRLHVLTGNSGEGEVRVENSSAVHSSGINFWTGTQRGFVGWRGTSSTSPFNVSGMYLINFDNSSLILGTNNLERMRIDSNGNVGIGSTPSASYRLQITSSGTVNGILVTTGTGGYPQVTGTDGTVTQFGVYAANGIGYAGTQSNHPYVLLTNNTERIRVDTSGNMGVGISPAAKLDVLGVIRSTSPDSGTVLDATALNGGTSYIDSFRSTGSALVFRTNSSGSGVSERVRIDSSGNVGIGLSPSTNLDVRSVIRSTSPDSGTLLSVQATNGGATYIDAFRTAGATLYLRVTNGSGTLLERFTVTQNGITVTGGVGVTQGIYANATDITAARTSTAGAYYFGTGGSKYLFFDGSSYLFGDTGVSITSTTLNATAIAASSLTLTTALSVANGGTASTTRKAASSSIANFGQLENHGTYTDFNSVQQWGGTYVQGSTNGPGIPSAGQYYQCMYSIGADYDWAGGNAYAMQMAIPRTPVGGAPYLSVRFKEGGGATSGWGSWSKIHAGYADTAGSVATSSNVQMSSLGVNTAASGTAGEIRATNNITAYYSDMRLKKYLGAIENPLEKLMSLKGFYYTGNEEAGKLGYNTETPEVGVSAQDVLEVLPEIVKPAPIDDKYYTLDYSRLVPLLIEAIKEQQNQINELKARLH